MKIVIIGVGGRLGATLLQEYREKFDVIAAFNHTQLDLANREEVRRSIDNLGFDVLINAAAFTNVDLCEKAQEQAFQINGEAPRVLAEICSEKRARLIHFSTDYVFDGEKREPYREEDEARPISVYGQSKLAGEENILAVQDRHLVVRVSWVFGPHRPSFVDAIVKRARESEHVDAIADKFSTPSYTRDIAEMLSPLFNVDVPGGIMHMANGGECSWQEFGQWALDCCRKSGMDLKAHTVAPTKLLDMKNFVARRPVYSALSTAKYASITGTAPRAWREAVADYILS